MSDCFTRQRAVASSARVIEDLAASSKSTSESPRALPIAREPNKMIRSGLKCAAIRRLNAWIFAFVIILMPSEFKPFHRLA